MYPNAPPALARPLALLADVSSNSFTVPAPFASTRETAAPGLAFGPYEAEVGSAAKFRRGGSRAEMDTVVAFGRRLHDNKAELTILLIGISTLSVDLPLQDLTRWESEEHDVTARTQCCGRLIYAYIRKDYIPCVCIILITLTAMIMILTMMMIIMVILMAISLIRKKIAIMIGGSKMISQSVIIMVLLIVMMKSIIRMIMISEIRLMMMILIMFIIKVPMTALMIMIIMIIAII